MPQPVKDAVEAGPKIREPPRQGAVAETKLFRDHLGPRLALWKEIHDRPFYLWQEPFVVAAMVTKDGLAMRLQDLQKSVVGGCNRDVQRLPERQGQGDFVLKADPPMKLRKTNFLICRECMDNAWLKMHKREVYETSQPSVFDLSLMEAGNEIDTFHASFFRTAY